MSEFPIYKSTIHDINSGYDHQGSLNLFDLNNSKEFEIENNQFLSSDLDNSIGNNNESFNSFNKIENDSLDNIKMKIEMQTYQMNRLQWYFMTCSFSDENGNPLFYGKKVFMDPINQFSDRRRIRKRNNYDKNHNLDSGIFMTFYGFCVNSGHEIIKCDQCSSKDKSFRNRKLNKKRSSHDKDDDHLIQVISDEETIDENGEIRLKIRFGCCIGVLKQHHINHVFDSENEKKVYIHKKCDGLKLEVHVKYPMNGNRIFYSNKPIRIFGKTSSNDISDSNMIISDNNNALEDSKDGFCPKFDDIEELDKIFYSRQNFKGCSSCASRKDRELFLKLTNSRDQFKYHVYNAIDTLFNGKYNQSIIQSYIMKLKNQATNDPTENSLLEIFHLCSFLAVDSCVYGYLDAAEIFWRKTVKLFEKLTKSNISKRENFIILAECLNRLSCYFSSGGSFQKGAYFNEKAYEILHRFYMNGNLEIPDLIVYETSLWSYITYSMDDSVIQRIRQFSITNQNTELHSYTLFLKIFISIFPDFKSFAESKLNKEINLMIYDEDDIKHTFEELIDVYNKCINNQNYNSDYKYERLIEDGFSSMENWIKNNHISAYEKAISTSIQCTLLENPIFRAFIPTYFACFICIKMMETHRESSMEYVDYAELCLKNITRIPGIRWTRIISEFILEKIKEYTGRVIYLNTCPLRECKLNKLQ